MYTATLAPQHYALSLTQNLSVNSRSLSAYDVEVRLTAAPSHPPRSHGPVENNRDETVAVFDTLDALLTYLRSTLPVGWVLWCGKRPGTEGDIRWSTAQWRPRYTNEWQQLGRSGKSL